jgi:hypothetical protein
MGDGAISLAHFFSQSDELGNPLVTVREIRRNVPPLSQETLLVAAGKVLTKARAPSRKERRRVAKLLVALFPRSRGKIKEILTSFKRHRDREMQFTLFCFLDEMPTGATARRELLASLKRYLLEVPSNAAHSAWMCADLLGDHIQTRAAIDVLIDAAQNAHHQAGRIASFHGLRQALSIANAAQIKRIKEVSSNSMESDRSSHVRFECKRTLETIEAKATRVRRK